jgi:hypothetical protein
MSEDTTTKGPEVVVKTKPKASKPKPKLHATTAKQLKELTVEINRLESLKEDRLALMKKAHAASAPTAEIAEAAGYSIARTRQLLSQ